MVTPPVIARVLETRVGLEVDALGDATVAAAVEQRRRAHDESVDAYAVRIAEDADERTRLVASLLVHETSFFRYPASFDLLAETLVGRAGTRPGPVRVLAVACATGQEALSVAIAALEAGLAPERLLVDALDVSATAIERARAGRYDGGGLRGLSPERRARWFEPDGVAARAHPALLARVRYAVGDALDPSLLPTEEPYDVVLCRNLLVYLTPAARDRVFATLRRLLRADGVLLVGHAEVLVARAAGFAPSDRDGTFACAPSRAPDPRPAVAPSPPPHRSGGHRTKARADAARVSSRSRSRAVVRASAPTAEVAAATPLDVARRAADAGRLAEARARVEDLLRAGQPSADAYHLLAVVHRAEGRAREAADALTRALYLDPSHRDALLLAALAADERGAHGTSERLRARAAAPRAE